MRMVREGEQVAVGKTNLAVLIMLAAGRVHDSSVLKGLSFRHF